MTSTAQPTALEQLERLTELFEERWDQAGSGSTEHLNTMLEEIQERRAALGMEPYTPPLQLPEPPEVVRMPSWLLSTGEDELMDRLRHLRAELQIRQDNVYSGVQSLKDHSIADMEFEDLDRKIHAIEQVLMSFGAVFRTRRRPPNTQTKRENKQKTKKTQKTFL